MKIVVLLLVWVNFWITLLPAQMPFQNGEKLTFDIKYGIVSAAEATMEVKSSYFQGKPVWHLIITTRTYSFFDVFFKVRDKVESWWDQEKLIPYKFSKNLQEGKYRQHRIHLYDHDRKQTTYQKWSFSRNRYNNTEMSIPAGTQDVLSAFYLVRTKQLIPGKSVYINITVDGRSVDTEVMVHRKETIKTIFGERECLVIEPKLRGEAVFKQTGRILIWVTNDSHKIPVKLDSKVSFGSFVGTLKSAVHVPYKIVN
ncbi:MAG: DUF3108 domain-containing protein [Candidatus Cloacimonetes bacterium]|nr:DUF3108 domain-containing protein [Candidatus Cloacimonadota bacterium]